MPVAVHALSYSNCVVKTEPIAKAWMPEFIAVYCNMCGKHADQVPSGKLKFCTRCSFAHYCSVECQTKVWKSEHRAECKHLAGKLEKWRNFETKYRLTDERGDFRMQALLLFRLLIRRDAGTLAAAGKLTGRKFAHLIADAEKICGINDAVYRKTRLHEMADIQRCASFLYDTDIDDETIFEYCEKIWQHATFGRCSDYATRCLSLYVDSECSSNTSACRPNAQFVEYGGKWNVIPLPGANGLPLFDAHNVAAWRTDASGGMLATKGVRRGHVERKFYRHCECARCVDPSDDFLSAIKCEKCDSSIPIDDSSFRRHSFARFGGKTPLSPSVLKRVQRLLPDYNARRMLTLDDATEAQKNRMIEDWYLGAEFRNLQLACPSCSAKVSPERVELALALMVVIETVAVKAPLPRDEINLLHRFDAECEKLLPDCNLYRGRLHRLMADDPSIPAAKRAERLLSWYAVVRKCIPRGHSHLRPELHALCEALLAASMIDKLRIHLAEYLQFVKILYDFGLQDVWGKLLLARLEAAFGITASAETDFSRALAALPEYILIAFARQFLAVDWRT